MLQSVHIADILVFAGCSNGAQRGTSGHLNSHFVQQNIRQGIPNALNKRSIVLACKSLRSRRSLSIPAQWRAQYPHRFPSPATPHTKVVPGAILRS